MTAGKAEFDDYIGEWRRESEPCGDDVEAAATERAAQLEAEFDRDVLAGVAANGGVRGPADA
jgi:hypothetical protein